MAELNIVANVLKSYVAPANEAIDIKLVRSESDLTDESVSFNPEFTHQVFGDSESIFGYKDLQIKLYYSAAKLTTYLSIKYSDKVNPDKFEGVQADDFEKELVEILQPGFLSNLDDFTMSVPKDEGFHPFGEMIKSFRKTDKENVEHVYEIYKGDVTTPGLKDYHERIQTFVLLFIDGASLFDLDDDKWHYFYIFEKYKQDGHDQYAILGFATVYHYYAYPDNIRPRISQFLILPPFQGNGLGTELLQTVYDDYVPRLEVVDITVEDPSEDFQRLRDFVDSRNCMKLASFKPDKLQSGFSDDMAHEAKTKLRINKKQAQRIYEILRLHVTDSSNKEKYRIYRLDVKKRLAQPYFREKRKMDAMKKKMKPEEVQATVFNREQRIEQLELQFKELEVEYRRVLDRLAATKL